MIGIVSAPDDVHAQAVCAALERRRAPWVMLDTSRIPTRARLTSEQSDGGWRAVWDDDVAGRINLDQIDVVWWRRPQPFELHAEVTDPVAESFVRAECAALLEGLWMAMEAEWVNDPDVDVSASRKLRQLQLAARLGLRVPRTCMTNDPDRARAFVAEHGEVIYKSFGCTPQTWRETRRVGDAEVEALGQVKYAPVIFQELIAGLDVRVTVVGEQVFPALIRPTGGYDLDFRLDAAPEITPFTLPADVEKGLLRLVQSLGLRYGAADFRLTPSGELVFLEVNPAGQWLFVEVQTGQPIAEALAELLVGLLVDGQ